MTSLYQSDIRRIRSCISMEIQIGRNEVKLNICSRRENNLFVINYKGIAAYTDASTPII